MEVEALDPAVSGTVAGEAESVNDGALGIELRSLIRACPLGVPHPVVRSKPAAAANPVLPAVMSCMSAA